MEKDSQKKFAKDKKCEKVRDHCQFTGKYWGAAHSICNLRFNMPSRITVGFHNDSNYDYYFIAQALANNLEEQFECFGENTEK